MQKIKYNRIEQEMKKQHISRLDLAAGIGASSSSIDNWCNNKIQPNLLWFLKIVAFLDVEPMDLLPESNPFEKVAVVAKAPSIGHSESTPIVASKFIIQLKDD